MPDKLALAEGHPLFANIVAICGTQEASGLVIDLVTGNPVGTLQAGATRGTDATYGAYVESDGSTGGINFSDVTWFDGRSACSFALLQISDLSAAGSNRAVSNKFTSGTQTFEFTWLSSDNLYTRLYTSDSTTTSANLTDGIHPTNGAPPQSVHLAGWTYGAGGLTTRANAFKANAALTGTINNSTWDLKVHYQWDGKLFGLVVFNKELSDTEWASIGGVDFLSLFGVAGAPSITSVTPSTFAEGDEVTIVGANMDLVTSLTINGDAQTTALVGDDLVFTYDQDGATEYGTQALIVSDGTNTDTENVTIEPVTGNQFVTVADPIVDDPFIYSLYDDLPEGAPAAANGDQLEIDDTVPTLNANGTVDDIPGTPVPYIFNARRWSITSGLWGDWVEIQISDGGGATPPGVLQSISRSIRRAIRRGIRRAIRRGIWGR